MLHPIYRARIEATVLARHADPGDYLVFRPDWTLHAHLLNGHRRPGSAESIRCLELAQRAAQDAAGYLVRFGAGAFYDLLPVRYAATQLEDGTIAIAFPCGERKVRPASPVPLSEEAPIVAVSGHLVLDVETPTQAVLHAFYLDTGAISHAIYAVAEAHTLCDGFSKTNC